MRADWEANRAELMAFWRSGKTEADVFPDVLPWLHGARQCRHVAVGGAASGLGPAAERTMRDPIRCRRLPGAEAKRQTTAENSYRAE